LKRPQSGLASSSRRSSPCIADVMGKSHFIVLRTDNEKAETIGPRAMILDSFKKADKFAKALSDRYPHQTFIVCQAVAVYQVRLISSVSALVPDEAEPGHRANERQSQTLAKQRQRNSASAKNIVEMSSRNTNGKRAPIGG